MGDDSEVRDREAKARLAADIALMKRASDGWKRLFGCVEERRMNADQALRGFQLYVEATLRDPAAAQRKLDELILNAAERAELERLREFVPELELRLTTATQSVERLTAENAVLKELIEAEQQSGASKPEGKPAVKPGRRCPSVAPSARTGDPVEDWRENVGNLFLQKGFNTNVPRPAITAEELAKGRSPKGGRELIFRPDGLLVPTNRLMLASGLSKDHFVLRPAEQDRIGFSPANEGQWFWSEVAESAPRRDGSFVEFEEQAPEGWEVMSLEEYFLTWLIMKEFCGAILDEDEPVCLRTTYTMDGACEILQIKSHTDEGGNVDLVVRSIPRDASLPNLGVRYRQLVPSVRSPE